MRSERGEGKLGGLVMLALIVALAWAAWNVAPVYFADYDFRDKVNEIARTPRYRAPTDEKVMDMLMKEVRERRLDPYVRPSNFQIITTETSRRIRYHYEREAHVLPGWRKIFRFDFTADQPLV
jgi:hypothetical protein